MITHAVLDHLWESTLFAVAAGLVTLFLQGNQARVRYWVWFVASLKFVVPFYLLIWMGSRIHWRHATAALRSSIPIDESLQHLGQALAAPEIAFRPLGSDAVSLAPICVSIWAIGCVVALARWFASWLQMRAIVRRAALADIPAPIPVRLAPAAFEPGVIGIVRPVLMLPTGIMERLTAAELETVIAHEMCHVRRRDNLTAAIHMVLEAVFWFHPFIWWIGARLLEERERACDEAVLGLGKDSQIYAESILKVCRFYVESKLPCVAGISGSNLKRRVKAIMTSQVMDRLSTFKRVALGAAAATVIAVPIAVGVTSSPAAVAQGATERADVFIKTHDNGRIQIGGTHIVITADDGSRAEIDPAGDLKIGGKNMPVTDDERQLLVQYSQNLRDMQQRSKIAYRHAWLKAPRIVGTALYDFFTGASDTQTDRDTNNAAKSLKDEVLKLCDDVKAEQKVQDQIGDFLPAFRPYAVIHEHDTEHNCHGDDQG